MRIRTVFPVVLAVLHLGAQGHRPDTIKLTLTYSEKNGLSGPSGQGDFAVGGTQAALGAAGLTLSMPKIGNMLQGILSGKEVQIPKTTGEINRQMLSNPASDLAATLPRSSGYHGDIDATLQWSEEKHAYIVQSGTLIWSTNNNSRFQAGDHLQLSNLASKSTHTLEPNEIIVKFSGDRMSESLGEGAEDPGKYTYSINLNIKPKPAPVLGESGWIVGGGSIYEAREKYTAGGVETKITDEYKATPDGNDIAATSHRATINNPPQMFDRSVSYEAEDREVKDGDASFAETWQDLTGAQVAISWSFDKKFKMQYGPSGLDVAALKYPGKSVDSNVFLTRVKNVPGDGNWIPHANFEGQVWVDGEKKIQITTGAMSADSGGVFHRVSSDFKIHRLCRTWKKVGSHKWEPDSEESIEDWIDNPGPGWLMVPPPKWNDWVVDEFLVQVQDRSEFGRFYVAYRMEIRKNAYRISYATPRRINKKEYDRIHGSDAPDFAATFDKPGEGWVELVQDPKTGEWAPAKTVKPDNSKPGPK